MTTAKEITTSGSKDKTATFILLSTDEKLTRTELKKTFRVKNGRLITIKGKYWHIGNLFDQLNAIKNSDPCRGVYLNFDSIKQVTHIYIVAQSSCTKTFGLVKYSNEFLGGYDLSQNKLEELETLLQEYREIASYCGQSKQALTQLQNNTHKVAHNGIGDSNRLQQLIKDIELEFAAFSYPNFYQALEKINSWREQHQWTDIESKGPAQNDSQGQLAA